MPYSCRLASSKEIAALASCKQSYCFQLLLAITNLPVKHLVQKWGIKLYFSLPMCQNKSCFFSRALVYIMVLVSTCHPLYLFSSFFIFGQLVPISPLCSKERMWTCHIHLLSLRKMYTIKLVQISPVKNYVGMEIDWNLKLLTSPELPMLCCSIANCSSVFLDCFLFVYWSVFVW